MAKAKTQPEEVAEAEVVTSDGDVATGELADGEVSAEVGPVPEPVPAGGNEPGVLPPSLQ